jgi:hypothetical protein
MRRSTTRRLLKLNESIELESILHGEFKAEWRAVKQARKVGHHDAKAPERYHAHSYKGRYKPIKIKRAMTPAGSMGFRRAAVVAQRTIARAITFGISRSALLRQVGLSRCLDNLIALDDALLTLSDVIMLGDRLRPPLVSVEQRAQMLTITVSGTWANTQYHRVPCRQNHRSRPICSCGRTSSAA